MEYKSKVKLKKKTGIKGLKMLPKLSFRASATGSVRRKLHKL